MSMINVLGFWVVGSMLRPQSACNPSGLNFSILVSVCLSVLFIFPFFPGQVKSKAKQDMVDTHTSVHVFTVSLPAC